MPAAPFAAPQDSPTTPPADHAGKDPTNPGRRGGRDANGRFTAGDRYGPGNPFARQTARLRKVLLEVVNEDELRQVTFALLLRAKTGNLTAIKLLLQYVLGKPVEAVDPDRLEVDEWKLSQESRVNPVAVHETVDHLPAETANVLVRHTWPASTQTNYLSAVREELEAMDTEDAQRARAAQERPAEANGDNGEESAKPQGAPHPPVGQAFQPDGPRSQARKPDRREEEGRGEVAARGGGHAKPQAARRAPRGGSGKAHVSAGGGHPTEANGSDGTRGGPPTNGRNGAGGSSGGRKKGRPRGRSDP